MCENIADSVTIKTLKKIKYDIQSHLYFIDLHIFKNRYSPSLYCVRNRVEVSSHKVSSLNFPKIDIVLKHYQAFGIDWLNGESEAQNEE